MTKLKPKCQIPLLVLSLIGILVLSSCKPSLTPTAVIEPTGVSTEIAATTLPYPGPVDKSEPEVEVQPDTREGDEGSLDVYPAPEASVSQQPSDVQPPQDAYPAPGEEIPRLKTELEATDPSTVSLASGEIQLVEFFAFW